VEAHSLSVVARSDVPETIDEILACEACGRSWPPMIPTITASRLRARGQRGRPGLNRPGDSILITAEGPVITARVTAPAGSTLRFICVTHPWMQGKLIVE
jgi:hypothetical protein